MSDEYKVIDRTESLLESVFKDIVTFGFLSFCIWIGYGSRWWTMVTGTMFLLFAFGKLSVAFKQRVKSFKTKEELIDWADSLTWPEKK